MNLSNSDGEGARFDQLQRFTDPSFLENNPVACFATAEETFEWEVFAVSMLDVSVPYNVPDRNDKEFTSEMEAVRKHSLNQFPNVSVGVEDQVLILSTVCLDGVPFGYTKSLAYPNAYRLVVAAKLVESRTK